MNYLLHVAIGFDQFLQSTLWVGTLGITVSARTGTAAAHQHLWGLWGARVLDCLLGKDHCKLAIENDRLRAHAVLKELSDPAVIIYLGSKA